MILIAPDFRGPILRVGANGGKAIEVTKVDGSKHTTHRWPTFLPDGKHFLYLATNHNGGKPEDNGVFYASLDGKEDRLIVPSDAGGEYASGYLLFHSGTALMAQAFDPGSGKLSGEPLPVVGKVRHDSGVWRTLFTVSQNGMLAYEPGSAEVSGSQLVWFDRTGKQLGQVGELGAYVDPRLSPDGKRLAISHGDPKREIWIFDLERGTKTRLTFSQATAVKNQPAWSPDGKTVVFTAGLQMSGGSRTALFTKAASGSGAEELIAGDTDRSAPRVTTNYIYGSWSPDGKYFVYIRRDGPIQQHVVARPTSGAGEPFTVAAPAAPQSNISNYRISPDSRWIAYSSDESGRVEVYIAPFPHGEGKWQVSSGGGDFATWRGDGKEIFFSTTSDQFTACAISVKGNELQIGTPQALFSANAAAAGVHYDVTADGKRFLINLAAYEAPAPLHLVVDWTADLKKK